MNLHEATSAAVSLIREDLARQGLAGVLDPHSPDGDPGKFAFAGVPVRVVAPHDGHYINVNLGWFRGVDAPAQINGGAIGAYCFVLLGPPVRYWLCGWRKMRDYVLDFHEASLSRYQTTLRWGSNVREIRDAPDAALFYWRDERATEQLLKPSRIVDLGNAAAVLSEVRPELRERDVHGVGRALGGEGQAHKLLKLYLSRHPELVGVSPLARVHLEYTFLTDDRVDLMFENHFPERTVVEIEVEGRDNLIKGVHQAVKYAALAGVERRAPLVSPRVRAHVVAYRTDYPAVVELADAYGVNLVAVDPQLCLVA